MKQRSRIGMRICTARVISPQSRRSIGAHIAAAASVPIHGEQQGPGRFLPGSLKKQEELTHHRNIIPLGTSRG